MVCELLERSAVICHVGKYIRSSNGSRHVLHPPAHAVDGYCAYINVTMYGK